MQGAEKYLQAQNSSMHESWLCGKAHLLSYAELCTLLYIDPDPWEYMILLFKLTACLHRVDNPAYVQTKVIVYWVLLASAFSFQVAHASFRCGLCGWKLCSCLHVRCLALFVMLEFCIASRWLSTKIFCWFTKGNDANRAMAQVVNSVLHATYQQFHFDN